MNPNSSENSCIKCKGKNPLKYCGRTFCPIIVKSNSKFKNQKSVKQDFQGSTPNIFIGRVGYPNLNVGILSPADVPDATLHDSPGVWSQQNFQIPQIIDLRSALINSRFMSNIKGTGKFIEIVQEVGMASKPVDIEINLKNKPRYHLNTDPFSAPMGPNAQLAKSQITSNTKIDTKVDKVVSDTDFKSIGAITQLYNQGYDENFLTKILSAGNLGIKYQRKLVPTRWSITAVDDILAKNLTAEIKMNETLDYRAYFGSYLGNYYLVLMFPEVWSYELFETYMPESSWNMTKDYTFTTDYESYLGRKTYAENCAGGYYAARLPILEKLQQLKKQSSTLVIRIISSEYYCPLGVFVVREATRKALTNQPICFENKNLMLNYAKLIIKRKFGYDITKILQNSLLLKEMNQQSKLNQFF